MVKAVVQYKIAQRVKHAPAVFEEACILLRIDAQRRQRDDDLRARFAVFAAPACKAAVFQLHFAQALQCALDRLGDLPALAVGRERRQCHGGHIRIGSVAGKAPAAVRLTLAQK